MDERHDEPGHIKTIWWYARKALREANRRRPVSFYLFLSIPIMLVVAVPVFYTRDDPKQFALHLSLIFLFLLIVMLRAVVDLVEIGRRHMSENREAFHTMLGDRDKDSEE